ncbi:MAG TPA: response regulator [Thermotogota bacterium]|jgi:DNA-binding response OmpR family regulator|nr:response regulator [Thermotogota bacterium]NLZ14193.1 response regulator [Thermotogaceae bacterium]MDD8040517.1 response regulator [Thermotogota bacterium]MDD8052494.1 response regulator [Thermotogota bacterium]HNR62603.1 response regulator [Thermotogota bacterium]
MEKPKILVVEDEDNMRFLISEELSDEGYLVDTAANGSECLQKFEENPYDLVTIDIEMPDMSGLELAGALRERKVPVRIILLTAYSHYKSDLSSWAADAYIVKSSNFLELKSTIKELLNATNH